MLNEYLQSYGIKRIDEFLEQILRIYSLKNLLPKMKEMNAYFLNLGFKKQEIGRMMNLFPSIYSYSISHLENQKEFFLKYGFSEKDIYRMWKIYPNMIGRSNDNLEDKLENYYLYGFSKKEIISFLPKTPTLLGKTNENISQKLFQLQLLGIPQKKVISVVTKFPSVLSIRSELIYGRVNYLCDLGFGRGQVANMIQRFPEIVCCEEATVDEKWNLIRRYFSHEDTLKILYALPNLLGLSGKNIMEKLDYIFHISIQDYMLEHPKNLMQSTALTYARYEFLKENGYGLDKPRKLFYGSKEFKEYYHVTNEELLKTYIEDVQGPKLEKKRK